MINISKIKRFACLTAAAAAFIMVGGVVTETFAQRDPFAMPSYKKKKDPVVARSGKPGTVGGPVKPVDYGPPPVEARIEYFKGLRQRAAEAGQELPKVTSVMTLNELAVSGIFKTPRGYAAMVEVTPIKLSYTVYPGEKFFDGQLVAVEENRLVFRKVTKVGANKYVASVENKALKQYTTRSQIEGTAPPQPEGKPVQLANNEPPVENPSPKSADKPSEKSNKPMAKVPSKKVEPTSNPFASPLDEMDKQIVPAATPEKAKKDAKKPAKVAKNKE